MRNETNQNQDIQGAFNAMLDKILSEANKTVETRTIKIKTAADLRGFEEFNSLTKEMRSNLQGLIRLLSKFKNNKIDKLIGIDRSSVTKEELQRGKELINELPFNVELDGKELISRIDDSYEILNNKITDAAKKAAKEINKEIKSIYKSLNDNAFSDSLFSDVINKKLETVKSLKNNTDFSTTGVETINLPEVSGDIEDIEKISNAWEKYIKTKEAMEFSIKHMETDIIGENFEAYKEARKKIEDMSGNNKNIDSDLLTRFKSELDRISNLNSENVVKAADNISVALNEAQDKLQNNISRKKTASFFQEIIDNLEKVYYEEREYLQGGDMQDLYNEKIQLLYKLKNAYEEFEESVNSLKGLDEKMGNGDVPSDAQTILDKYNKARINVSEVGGNLRGWNLVGAVYDRVNALVNPPSSSTDSTSTVDTAIQNEETKVQVKEIKAEAEEVKEAEKEVQKAVEQTTENIKEAVKEQNRAVEEQTKNVEEQTKNVKKRSKTKAKAKTKTKTDPSTDAQAQIEGISEATSEVKKDQKEIQDATEQTSEAVEKSTKKIKESVKEQKQASDEQKQAVEQQAQASEEQAQAVEKQTNATAKAQKQLQDYLELINKISDSFNSGAPSTDLYKALGKDITSADKKNGKLDLSVLTDDQKSSVENSNKLLANIENVITAYKELVKQQEKAQKALDTYNGSGSNKSLVKLTEEFEKLKSVRDSYIVAGGRNATDSNVFISDTESIISQATVSATQKAANEISNALQHVDDAINNITGSGKQLSSSYANGLIQTLDHTYSSNGGFASTKDETDLKDKKAELQALVPLLEQLENAQRAVSRDEKSLNLGFDAPEATQHLQDLADAMQALTKIDVSLVSQEIKDLYNNVDVAAKQAEQIKQQIQSQNQKNRNNSPGLDKRQTLYDADDNKLNKAETSSAKTSTSYNKRIEHYTYDEYGMPQLDSTTYIEDFAKLQKEAEATEKKIEKAQAAFDKWKASYTSKTAGKASSITLDDGTNWSDIQKFKIEDLDDIDKTLSLMESYETKYSQLESNFRKGSSSLNIFANAVKQSADMETTVQHWATTVSLMNNVSQDLVDAVKDMEAAATSLGNADINSDIVDFSEKFGKTREAINIVKNLYTKASDESKVSKKNRKVNAARLVNIQDEVIQWQNEKQNAQFAQLSAIDETSYNDLQRQIDLIDQEIVKLQNEASALDVTTEARKKYNSAISKNEEKNNSDYSKKKDKLLAQLQEEAIQTDDLISKNTTDKAETQFKSLQAKAGSLKETTTEVTEALKNVNIAFDALTKTDGVSGSDTSAIEARKKALEEYASAAEEASRVITNALYDQRTSSAKSTVNGNKILSKFNESDIADLSKAENKIDDYADAVKKAQDAYAELKKYVADNDLSDASNMDVAKQKAKELSDQLKDLSSNKYNSENGKGKYLQNLSSDFSKARAEAENYVLSLKDIDSASLKWSASGNTLTYLQKSQSGVWEQCRVNVVRYADGLSQLRSVSTGVESSTSKLSKALGDMAHAGLSGLGEIVGRYASFSDLINYARQGISVFKEYDAALTDISYTTEGTAAKISELGKEYVNLAKEMSASVEDTMEVASIYANLQTSTEEVMQSVKPTIMLSNATGVSASTASDQIQGVLQQFNLAASESEHVVDVFESLASNVQLDFGSAITAISEGVSTAGQTASEAGLSFEQLAAVIANMAEVTRDSGSEVGTSLRTMMARLSKSGTMSEDVSADDLSNAAKSLSSVGIEVYTPSGEYREFTTIISELREKWDSLTDAQQSNIAYQVNVWPVYTVMYIINASNCGKNLRAFHYNKLETSYES